MVQPKVISTGGVKSRSDKTTSGQTPDNDAVTTAAVAASAAVAATQPFLRVSVVLHLLLDFY